MKKYLLFLLIILLFSCDEHKFTNPADPANELATVTNLTAAIINETTLRLDWQYSGTATHIRIDRQTGNAEWLENFALLPADQITYLDNAVTIGTEYTYRLAALCDENQSAFVTVNKLLSIEVPQPTFSPAGGAYNEELTITLSCAASGAAIYYTTDGSEPTAASTLYNTPLAISSSKIIKAKAFKTNWIESHTATAVYNLYNMIFVAGGTFNNGTSDVNLTSYLICPYEVTQAEYSEVMGSNPSNFSDHSSKPVEMVSWLKAIEYCNRRSSGEGYSACYSYGIYGTNPAEWPVGWEANSVNHTNVSCDWSADGYRLPTEAEWQYAASGGNASQNYLYSGSSELSLVAWYAGNANNITHTVGGKTANELGIYDLSGNIWEWCWDIFGEYPAGNQTNPQGALSGEQRVMRGGSWSSIANYCTVAFRASNIPSGTFYITGFRICRSAF